MRDVISHVAGSTDWLGLRSWTESIIRRHKIDLEPKLPENWSVKIGSYKYSEEWIRRYAFVRHFHGCIVMASDYANKYTGVYHPIVRSFERDRKLLSVMAKIAQEAASPANCVSKSSIYE